MRPKVRLFAERDRPALEAIYGGCRKEAAWLPAAVKKCSDFSRDTEGEAILVAVGQDDEPEGFISVWKPDRFEAAIALYRTLGFATEGVKRKARKLDGRYEDNVLMAVVVDA